MDENRYRVTYLLQGREPREETHVPKVVGSNPRTIYWMEIFSHKFVVKIVLFV